MLLLLHSEYPIVLGTWDPSSKIPEFVGCVATCLRRSDSNFVGSNRMDSNPVVVGSINHNPSTSSTNSISILSRSVNREF